MHVLFLTDNFPPEVNAPASRTFEHCREWVRAGHRVTVLTCAPNFPTGQVYQGYRNKLWQKELVDGIQVIRVWSYVAPNAGFTRRIADYLSFMVSATLASPFVRAVDIVVGTSPQFFTACAAYAASILKRAPFVFELRDIWPESVKAVGAAQDSVWLRALEQVELFLYRRARRIISVTQSFRLNLIERGIDARKISVVTNGVDTTRFHPRDRDPDLAESLGLSGNFVAGYVGTLGLAHGLDTILDAADLLRARPGGEHVRFLILGDGAERQGLIARASQRQLTNIVFVRSVAKDDVARYWALLDVAIIHLRASLLFRSVIPSKLFECFGMGIPTLLGVRGEAETVLTREDAGLSFAPEDCEALVDGLVQLRDRAELRERFRTNALRAARKYERRNLAIQMLEILQSEQIP